MSLEIQIFAMAKDPNDPDGFILADSFVPPEPVSHYDIQVRESDDLTGNVNIIEEYEDLTLNETQDQITELVYRLGNIPVEWV